MKAALVGVACALWAGGIMRAAGGREPVAAEVTPLFPVEAAAPLPPESAAEAAKELAPEVNAQLQQSE